MSRRGRRGLAGCGFAAAPAKSDAAVLVGIGEQDASMFSDPLFTQVGFKQGALLPVVERGRRKPAGGRLARPVARRGAGHRHGAADLVLRLAWLAVPEPKPCKLPTVRQYTKAFKAFRKRWPQVKVISPWNEANHRSQPTFKNPKRAAQYYNVVRKYCRGCKIVAADVIDEKNMERWLKVFKKTAKKPRIWGLHNYRDTNKRKGQLLGGTKRLLKAVKGDVWLTETGGIVKFVLPNGAHAVPVEREPREPATKRMFALAKRYRARIKRLYIYHWKQPSTNRTTASTPGCCRCDGTGPPRVQDGAQRSSQRAPSTRRQ